MAVVPRALGLVAAFAILGTAMYLDRKGPVLPIVHQFTIAMAVIPRGLGLAAAFAVLGTAMYLVYRYNKNKGVVNIKMEALDQSSSRSSSKITGKFTRPLNSGNAVHQVLQLNESLFELYKPCGKPSLQILFFHGFQFGEYDSAHISTWESEDQDGTFIWPQTWLRDEFPDAHILSIAYNCRMKESRDDGSAELFILGENLMADLLAENIGQDRRCPVVLVGHSFGGLVMKKLCLIARNKGSTGSTEHKKFLENVNGLFFYSTPHGGIRSEEVPPLFESKSLLLENVESLSTSTARLNDDFEKLRHFYKWRTAGVGESCVTKWGSHLSFMVVREASSRYGDYFVIVPGASHITISRPEKKTSTTYTFCRNFIRRVDETRKVSGVIHRVHGLPDVFSGLEKRVGDVEKKLKMHASQATVLGIVGMGGIGKTTIAKQLFNDISSRYEYTCFVDNVKGIPIHDLEDRLLRNFHRDGKSLKKNEIEWSSVENKKALIIMDDVSSEDQLNRLPKLDYFGGDSHLIITSRDHNVCNFYQNCVLYDVEFLTPDEAKKLLCQHVFDMETIERDHHLADRIAQYVDKLVQKCQGLPLTLEVMGRYLRQHRNKVEFWKEVIRKLGETQPISGSKNDRVWASLKVSLDDLPQEEQQMFFEAGTCFFEQPLQEALAAWSTPHGCAEMALENLIRRSLVKVVTTRRFEMVKLGVEWRAVDYEEIWVHEQLRDLARNISQREFRNDIYTFIPYHTILMKAAGVDADYIDDIHERSASFWFDRRVTTVEEGSLIEPLHSYNQPRTTLQLELLEKLENLKYVYLKNIIPQGFTRNFPQSISLLKWILGRSGHPPGLPEINWKDMNNLGLLHLANWTISREFIGALGTLTNLRSLMLAGLEGFDCLPEEIGNLFSLKQLELSGLEYLSALPESFGNLSALEQLNLGDLGISQLPESFGGLYSLRQLHIAHCPELRSLPESFGGLHSLEKLKIYRCAELTGLPESFGGLYSLENFHIENCRNLWNLPESIGDLCSLETLSITNCKQLRSLPESIGGLRSLKILSISNCKELRSLPASVGGLCSLEQLSIECCESLESLPESIGGLRSLKLLSIGSCKELRSLPESIGDLSSLVNVSIKGCESVESLQFIGGLRSLLDSFGHRSCLKKLSLWNVDVETLPASFELLLNLEDLELRDFRKLKRLPLNFGKLSKLERVILQNCSSLEELPASFGLLSSLKELEMVKCSSLQRLPDNLGELNALKYLILTKCPTLQSLPHSFGQLKALDDLTLSDCPTLESLPHSFGELKALKSLKLENCPTLKSLPDNFGQLKALKDLELKNCPLQSFPDYFGQLEALDWLTLENCPMPQSLPDTFGQLKALKTLLLSNCPTLQSLPDTFGQLKALRWLHLSDCPMLQSLPDNFGQLKALERLTLDGCSTLQSFPDTFGQLKDLKELALKDCQTLQSLPHNFDQLKTLEELTVRNCPALQSLPRSLHERKGLRIYC